MYVKGVPPPDMNRNTEWFMYPGVWTTYILIIFFGWLAVLSVSGCAPGMAWTVVNLSHFLVSLLRICSSSLGFTGFESGYEFLSLLLISLIIIGFSVN